MYLEEMGWGGFLLVCFVLYLAFFCSRGEEEGREINATVKGFDPKIESISDPLPSKEGNNADVNPADRADPEKSLKSKEDERGKNNAEGKGVEGREFNKFSLGKTDVSLKPDNGSNPKERLGMKTNESVSLHVEGEQKQNEKKEEKQMGDEQKQDEKKEEKQMGDEQKQDEKKEENQMGDKQKQDDKKMDVDGQLDPRTMPKEGMEKGDSSTTKPSKKGNSRAEECDDASKMCTDEKNKLVACLRFLGSELPHLSLLIQNKGTGELTVNIKGPAFVKLEEKTVRIPEKEGVKVTVSIEGSSDNNSVIVLTTVDSNCTLDLKDILTDYSSQNPLAQELNSSSLMTWTSALYFSLATFLLIGAAWTYLKFRRRKHGDDRKYQVMEMGLPVSDRGKLDSDTIDGWDNSWGDGWDDEEAPITPSKPIQNLSSKGLASRRSSKDGSPINSWKD